MSNIKVELHNPDNADEKWLPKTCAEQVFMSDGTDVDSAVTALNSNTELSISLNTTNWSSNTTWAEKNGNVVCVHMYCVGTPSKQTVASGLPIPRKIVNAICGQHASDGQSIFAIGTDGVLRMTSNGGSNASYFSADITYLAQ